MWDLNCLRKVNSMVFHIEINQKTINCFVEQGNIRGLIWIFGKHWPKEVVYGSMGNLSLIKYLCQSQILDDNHWSEAVMYDMIQGAELIEKTFSLELDDDCDFWSDIILHQLEKETGDLQILQWLFAKYPFLQSEEYLFMIVALSSQTEPNETILEWALQLPIEYNKYDMENHIGEYCKYGPTQNSVAIFAKYGVIYPSCMAAYFGRIDLLEFMKKTIGIDRMDEIAEVDENEALKTIDFVLDSCYSNLETIRWIAENTNWTFQFERHENEDTESIRFLKEYFNTDHSRVTH